MNFDRELDDLRRHYLADSENQEAKTAYLNALRRRNNLPSGEWLQLNDGTQIQLRGIFQQHTWVGVIDGLPQPRHNSHPLISMESVAQTLWPDMSMRILERDRWETGEELLPYVSCCARFNGTTPAKGYQGKCIRPKL